MVKKMLRVGLALAIAMAFLISAGYAADSKYSADAAKKIDEFKLLRRDKKDMPESLSGIKNITAEELKSWIDQKKKIVILDNRPADEYEKEHIPGAARLNSDD